MLIQKDKDKDKVIDIKVYETRLNIPTSTDERKLIYYTI